MREEEAYNKQNIIYFGAMCNFSASDNFQDNFVDFRFMFTQGVMKKLARILIRVRKIFTFRMSFKILLSMSLAVIEKEYSCDQVTPRMAPWKKIPYNSDGSRSHPSIFS